MKDLSDLEVPGPTKTSLTAPFWDNAAKGRLVIQKCDDCSRHFFYPRPLCPSCWSPEVRWSEVSGLGRLQSFSEIWKPGHPGWISATPFLVGLVKLEEGPTLLSHIFADSNQVSVGDHLVFVPHNIGGQILPCFKKSEFKEETP